MVKSKGWNWKIVEGKNEEIWKEPSIESYYLINRWKEQGKKKRKYEYKISFEDVLPIARRFIKHRMRNDIVKALMLRHQTAIKVKQQTARQVRSQTVKPLNNRA